MALSFRVERVNRRRFLVGGSAVAVGAGLAPGFGRGFLAEAALARDVAHQPSEAAWRQLADKLSGPVLRANSFDLSQIAVPYNARYAGNLPDAIALCRSAEDVAFAITWCNENRFPLVVQSGGHSYAGCSMRKGGLMINLLLMRSAEMTNGNLTVAGGMRNRDLYTLLEQNNSAVTHGRCPNVGAAGFLLGGGIGFNMRAHGLACDQLTTSEIVTADGKIRTIGPQASGIDGDLYWACRGGGGGNFGINTSFTLATFPAEPLTVFNLTWTAATRRSDKVALALIAGLENAPLDLALGTRMSLHAPHPKDRARGSNVLVSLVGQLRGTPKALDDILAPAYAVAKPQQAMIWGDAPYWAAQKLLEEVDGPIPFQERSAFVASGQAEKATAHTFHHLLTWPGTSGVGDLRFFQTGGKINDTDAKATAFAHRNSAWIMDVGLTWSPTDSAHAVVLSRDWQDRLYAAVRPFSTGGAYQNFIDPSLDDWRNAYYRENLGRLEEIKKKIDPGRVFAFPQAV
jgi:FAD/FMN-containing dehydrogenase